MGQIRILGRYADPRAPVFQVEERAPDGSTRLLWVGRGALHHVAERTASDVLREVAGQRRGDACESFAAGPVLDEVCRCGWDEEAHALAAERRVEEALYESCRELAQAALAAAVGVPPARVYVSRQDRDGRVTGADYGSGDADTFSLEQWAAARAACEWVGPWPYGPEAEKEQEHARRSSDDIDF
jgi:hypothetical protein